MHIRWSCGQQVSWWLSLPLSFYVAPRDGHEVGHKVHLESQGQPTCEKEKHLDEQVSITACN